jgi:WD40 repeat protein/serine/threonine protein kinase
MSTSSNPLPDIDRTRDHAMPASSEAHGCPTPPPPAGDNATGRRAAPEGADTTRWSPPPTGALPWLGHGTLPCAFGEYELVEVIGQGGMGVVYKARQRVGSGERFVALKMIQAGRLASPDAVGRFLQEARAAATLDHPGIVPIHDVGQIDEQHYFTMPLLTGGSLADQVRDGPLPHREAARIVHQVAHAVQYAHEHGIIHRDLKPANILLTDPRPDGKEQTDPGAGSAAAPASGPWSAAGVVARVTDFGLARTRQSELSVTGQALGTPSYMSPEQARGQVRAVGPASDVYGLGAVLYCLLTGRPPFSSSDPVQTMLQVCADEPVPPRQLNRSVPRDLETITMKCLEKEPWHRYGSALELADDLRRFVDGRPIRARPVSSWEHVRKWASRHPAVALLSAAVVLVTLMGVALVSWQWHDARANARAEKLARHESERLLCSSEVDVAIALCERGDVGEGMLRLARELERAVRLREVDLERVIRVNLTAWRKEAPMRVAYFQHKEWAWDVALSPDGRTAFVGGSDRKALLWDTHSGKLVGKPMIHPGAVLTVAFSPDGRTVLTGCSLGTGPKLDWKGGGVRLWDGRTGEPLGPSLPGPGGVHFVSFNRDGKRVLTLAYRQEHSENGLAGVARLWEVTEAADGSRTLRPSHILPHPLVHVARFSPDGRTVLTAGYDGQVCFWDAQTGTSTGPVLRHPAPVLCADFRGDNRRIVTGCMKEFDKKRQQAVTSEARVWDLQTGKMIDPVVPIKGSMHQVHFSPGGSEILSAAGIPGSDPKLDKGEVRVWEAATGRLLYDPIEHPEPVWAVAFSPNGRTFLSGCRDRHARLYVTATGAPVCPPMGHEGNVRSVAFSADGRHFLTGCASDNGRAQLWTAPAASTVGLSLSPAPREGPPCPADFKYPYRGLELSPDGKYLISSADSGSAPLRVWDVKSRKEVGSLGPMDGWPTAVAISPDSRLVAVSTTSCKVRFVSLVTRRPIGPVLEPSVFATSLAFSPDGRSLVTPFASSGVMQRWDVSSGARLGEPMTPGNHWLTAWGPRGDRIVCTGTDGVCVFDAKTGECLAHHQRGEYLTAVAFAPDGRMFATGHSNRSVRFWHTDDAGLVGRHLPHRDAVIALAFSPNGRLLATGSADKTTRLWDVTTGKPLGPPLLHRLPVTGVCFLPTGRQIVTRAGSAVQFWERPGEWPGAPAEVRREVEVLTRRELDETGTPRELSPEARLQDLLK